MFTSGVMAVFWSLTAIQIDIIMRDVLSLFFLCAIPVGVILLLAETSMDVQRNLWMAWLHNEVWMHILGYVCFFSLFVACFFSRVITVHVHHWVWSGSLACFSRFSSGFSRFFHAVCLGIFVHGVSFYGGDPIFSS